MNFLGCLVKEKNSYEVSACFFYQLLFIIIVPKAATKFLFCLSSQPAFKQKFLNQKPVSEQLLKSHRRLHENRNKLPDEVTGRISKLVSDFKEASTNFNYNFLRRKAAKYCENHQR